MNMRNDSDVPRVTGQGAREETGCIMNEMGDDHFDDFQREPGDGG